MLHRADSLLRSKSQAVILFIHVCTAGCAASILAGAAQFNNLALSVFNEIFKRAQSAEGVKESL